MDLLHLHLVPNIKDTQCASSNIVLKEVAEIKLVQMVFSKINKKGGKLWQGRPL